VEEDDEDDEDDDVFFLTLDDTFLACRFLGKSRWDTGSV